MVSKAYHTHQVKSCLMLSYIYIYIYTNINFNYSLHTVVTQIFMPVGMMRQLNDSVLGLCIGGL